MDSSLTTDKAARQTRPARIFYGWIVLAACFICAFTYTAFYTIGVFFSPIREEFGWSYTLTSSFQTLHIGVWFISTYLMGYLSDRFGPKLPVFLGALLLGGGIALLSRAQSLTHFYIFYAIASVGAGVCWSLPVATAQKWFIKRYGVAVGIVSAGVGVGLLIISPLANSLIASYGWRLSYMMLGIGYGVLLLIAAIFIDTPKRRGMLPYGAEKIVPQGQASMGEGLSLREVLKIKAFWLASFSYCTFHIALFMMNVHLVPFAELVGIDKAAASMALGIIGGAGILSKTLVPPLTERTIGFRRGAIIVCILMGLSILYLTQVRNLEMLLIFAFAFGLIYGAMIPQIVGLVHSMAGSKALGQVIGVAHDISLFGAALGPLLAGLIIDRTGSYYYAFLIAALASFTAAGCAAVMRLPRRKLAYIK